MVRLILASLFDEAGGFVLRGYTALGTTAQRQIRAGATIVPSPFTKTTSPKPS